MEFIAISELTFIVNSASTLELASVPRFIAPFVIVTKESLDCKVAVVFAYGECPMFCDTILIFIVSPGSINPLLFPSVVYGDVANIKFRRIDGKIKLSIPIIRAIC